MKHVYNKSANFTESYAAHIDYNGPSNLTEIVPLIGMNGGCGVTCLSLLDMRSLDSGHM